MCRHPVITFESSLPVIPPRGSHSTTNSAMLMVKYVRRRSLTVTVHTTANLENKIKISLTVSTLESGRLRSAYGLGSAA